MRFCQIDRIIELHPGKKLVAVKGLTMAEEYLKDHFPRFPVMPGVIMLEAMFQAGMWLVQATEDFRYSTVALAEVNQLKFHDFVEPGNQLIVTAEWKKSDDQYVEIRTRGDIGDRVAVRGQLVLERFNLADRGLEAAEVDHYMVHEHRRLLRRLQDPRKPYNARSNSLDNSELVASPHK